MGKMNESQLRFIVKKDGYENITFIISGYPSSINNIQQAIREFAFRKKDLSINPVSNTEFELNTKSYLAIQHIIAEKMF